MTRSLLTLAAALALAVPVSAQPRPEMPNTMAMGPDFVLTAAATDEFERRAGTIAAERARDPRVRAFGQMMVEAHSQSAWSRCSAACDERETES
jgi:hypothetical protein